MLNQKLIQKCKLISFLLAGLVLPALLSMNLSYSQQMDPSEEETLIEVPRVAPIVTQRAARIFYFGGITGFDNAGYQTIRQVIGARIADGTLAVFKTEEFGLEGGVKACIELERDPHLSIEPILAQLRAIKPQDKVTVFTFETLENCP